MEFEHLGQHCSLPTCRQRDFLPFVCNVCRKPYCLSHRNYDQHGCEGSLMRDMTSIDCPICKKSVKFDKSQDVNDIWEQHYFNNCTQTASAQANSTFKSSGNTEKCARQGCRTILGLSTTFQCPKCHKRLCLSHRYVDEHTCITSNRPTSSSSFSAKPTSTNIATSSKAMQTRPENNSRLTFLDKVESKTVKINPQRKPPASTTAISAKAISNNPLSPPPTAAPAPQLAAATPVGSSNSNNSGSGAPLELMTCPMCEFNSFSLEEISRHVDNVHLSGSSNGPSSNTQASSSYSGNYRQQPTVVDNVQDQEICPHCSQRFFDPVQLINHVESVHSNSNSGGDQGGCSLS